MSEHKKLYNTKRWKLRRLNQLARSPLCCECEKDNKVTIATIADHITPHRGDEYLFFYGPLQSMCKHHHDSYKQRLEKSGTVLGCDESGLPIDPNHHWHMAGGVVSK